MNAIIVPEDQRREARGESTSIIQVIERAARDPGIDIDKMERLLAMKERLDARAAVEAFNTAFAQMQIEMPEIDERGQIKVNDVVRSTYATFEDINAVVKPVLTKYGFGLSFRTATKEKKVEVTAILMHKAGHREELSMELDADTSGSKNAVQALGSSISYAKRYTMSAVLNITTRGLDDDGRKGGAGPMLTDEQVKELDELISKRGGNKAKLMNYLRLRSFAEVPACNFEHVKAEIIRAADAKDAKDAEARRSAEAKAGKKS